MASRIPDCFENLNGLLGSDGKRWAKGGRAPSRDCHVTAILGPCPAPKGALVSAIGRMRRFARDRERPAMNSHENHRRCRPRRRFDVGICHRHHRRRLELHLPGTLEVVGCLQEETGNGSTTSRSVRAQAMTQIEARHRRRSAPPTRRSSLTSSRSTVCAQWPMVVGGIVPVVNIDGVKPGEMVLDGAHPRRHLPRQDHQLE